MTSSPPKSDWRRMLADTVRMSWGTVVNIAVGFFGAFAIARLLLPDLYGVWKIAQTIFQYAGHTHLGLFNALAREGPALHARGDQEALKRLTRPIFTVAFALAALEAAALFSIAASMNARPDFAFALAVVGVMAVFLQTFCFIDVCFSVLKDFRFKSRAMIVYSISRFALMVGALWLFGFPGLMIAFAAALAATTLWMARRLPAGLMGFTRRMGDIARLYRIGLPIFGIVLIETLLQTADRLVVAFARGFEAVGYYGLTTIVVPVVLLLPSALRQVVSIEVFAIGGREGGAPLATLFHRSSRGLAYTMPWVCAAAYLSVEWGVRYLLPRYLPGLAALKILCFGAFPLALASVSFSFLIVRKREARVIVAGMLAAGVCAALSYWRLSVGGSLSDVALIHSAGFTLFAVTILADAEGYVGRRSVAFWAHAFLPWIGAVLAAAATERIGPSFREAGAGAVQAGLWTALRLGVFSVIWLPALAIGFHGTGLKTGLLSMFRRGEGGV